MTQYNPSAPVPQVNDPGAFEIGSFDFHGKPVVILTNAQGSWAVLGQLCANLTLDANGQRQTIERKSWSKGKTCVTHVILPGQNRAYPQFLIHERIVPMWLANITSSRIEDPTIRTNIEQAQVELADALHEYVSRRSRVSREPSKLEVARDLVAALEAKEALEAANKVLAPKAGKWDEFLATDGLIGMRETADLFRTDVRSLTAWLVQINIFRKAASQNGGNRHLPRKAYCDSGHFKTKIESKNGWSFPVAYVTATGLDLIDDLWKQRANAA